MKGIVYARNKGACDQGEDADVVRLIAPVGNSWGDIGCCVVKPGHRQACDSANVEWKKWQQRWRNAKMWERGSRQMEDMSCSR